MRKVEYINTLEYIHEPAHKGAPYKVGETYKNAGELMEMIAKNHLGIDFTKDGTSFDKGDDIEELNASVKSSKATLAPVTGNTMDEILDQYFTRVHSNRWIYVVMNGENITEYHMNRREFEMFVRTFATVTKERKVVRFRATTKKMVAWLDERA